MKTTCNISLAVCAVFIFVTACQKESVNNEVLPVQITLQNPGFEDSLKAWTIETSYKGEFGFSSSKDAVRSGTKGLNFYAPQTHHFTGAPQETPWNGRIFQSISGLKDGNYTFKVYADAVGNGMYVWASSGEEEVKARVKSTTNEMNSLDFVVRGGVAKIGFVCINANGDSTYAPYFHADDAELWTR